MSGDSAILLIEELSLLIANQQRILLLLLSCESKDGKRVRKRIDKISDKLNLFENKDLPELRKLFEG